MKQVFTVSRALGVMILLWPILPPLLHACNLHAFAEALEWPWAQTCHRNPARTLHFVGWLMPMCSRCMGLDVGFGLGLVVAMPYRGPKLMWGWMAIAGALLFVEMWTQERGLHPIWHATRFLTGALLAYPIGVAIANVVLPSRPQNASPPH
jgi:uncharacterized membrane protein